MILRAGDVASSCKPLIYLLAVNSPLSSLSYAVSVRFAFLRVEGNVGEPLHYQVVVTSQAHEGSAAVELSGVSVRFEEILRAVRIQHHARPAEGLSKAADKVHIQDVALHETSSFDGHLSESSPPPGESKTLLVGSADLTFLPGQIKAFTLTSIPRDAGHATAVSCTLSMEEELFDLDYIVPFDGDQMQASWWTQRKSGPAERCLSHDQPASIKILPRPPKLEIQLPNIRSEYYTDESIVVDVDIINNEEEEAEAAIEVRLLGQSEGTPELSWAWASTKYHDEVALPSPSGLGSQTTHLSRRAIGKLAPAAKAAETFTIRAKSNPAEYVLEIKILYHLASEPNTPLSKTLTSDIVCIGPFEANYDFSPRLHPDQWPSFFWVEDDGIPDGLDNISAKSVDGITQKWCLTARMASFAAELLTVEAMAVSVLGINGAATANVSLEERNGWAKLVLGRNEEKEVCFTLDVHMLTLEDRRPASLDLALDIGWRRAHPAAELNTTSLSVPRLLVPGAEPRVLASVRYQVPGLPALIHLDYVFENPSMHFLTFNLAMEASEHFAFSGPKATSLQLVALSRHTVRYSLLPYAKGTWIQPQLKVVDMYFNKLLRISATEGMKSDKKGVLIWVYADS